MLNHYYGDNLKTLCCERDNLKNAIETLNAEDLENIRHLLSFRPFVEEQNSRTVISLFEDDIFFKNMLFKKMNELYDYIYSFYLCLRLFLVFVKDLPGQSLGKSVSILRND